MMAKILEFLQSKKTALTMLLKEQNTISGTGLFDGTVKQNLKLFGVIASAASIYGGVFGPPNEQFHRDLAEQQQAKLLDDVRAMMWDIMQTQNDENKLRLEKAADMMQTQSDDNKMMFQKALEEIMKKIDGKKN